MCWPTSQWMDAIVVVILKKMSRLACIWNAYILFTYLLCARRDYILTSILEWVLFHVFSKKNTFSCQRKYLEYEERPAIYHPIVVFSFSHCTFSGLVFIFEKTEREAKPGRASLELFYLKSSPLCYIIISSWEKKNPPKKGNFLFIFSTSSDF